MANPWFRMYAEFADDPKVQVMSESLQRRLVMVFCLRCKEHIGNGDETLQETEIAFHLRISPAELAKTKAIFTEKGFIDEHWNVLSWAARQYLSDSSTERVRKHRRGLKQSGTLPETPVTGDRTAPDTDADAEAEKTKAKAAAAKASAFVLPEWIAQEIWTAFEEMRRKIRKPMTDQARKNIVAKLIRLEAQGFHAEAVLNESITNGWSGVFPLADGNGARNGSNRNQQRTDGNIEAARRAAEAIAHRNLDGASGGAPGVGECGDLRLVRNLPF